MTPRISRNTLTLRPFHCPFWTLYSVRCRSLGFRSCTVGSLLKLSSSKSQFWAKLINFGFSAAPFLRRNVRVSRISNIFRDPSGYGRPLVANCLTRINLYICHSPLTSLAMNHRPCKPRSWISPAVVRLTTAVHASAPSKDLTCPECSISGILFDLCWRVIQLPNLRAFYLNSSPPYDFLDSVWPFSNLCGFLYYIIMAKLRTIALLLSCIAGSLAQSDVLSNCDPKIRMLISIFRRKSNPRQNLAARPTKLCSRLHLQPSLPTESNPGGVSCSRGRTKYRTTKTMVQCSRSPNRAIRQPSNRKTTSSMARRRLS